VQDIWYGDRRDLVKWGTVLHLARRHGIHTVLHVAFLRRPRLKANGESWPIADEIWQHFRDVHHIRGLGRRSRLRIAVVDDPFEHSHRNEYLELVVQRLKGLGTAKVVLLDPDTGMSPVRTTPEHVRVQEVGRIWRSLSSGDWLVLYQHRSRDPDWCRKAERKLRRACPPAPVHVYTAAGLASDVALLAVRRT
jgi:hypothetical protein